MTGSASLVTVFASHFATGYDDTIHLAPPYLAAIDLALALWILHRPQFSKGIAATRTTEM